MYDIQVAQNGVVEVGTKNVKEIAYVHNQIWYALSLPSLFSFFLFLFVLHFISFSILISVGVESDLINNDIRQENDSNLWWVKV